MLDDFFSPVVAFSDILLVVEYQQTIRLHKFNFLYLFTSCEKFLIDVNAKRPPFVSWAGMVFPKDDPHVVFMQGPI